MEQAGEGGRATDQVASRDGQAELLSVAQLGELGGEVLSATCGNAIDRPGRGSLEMAVVVVEGQELDWDLLAGRVGTVPVAGRVGAVVGLFTDRGGDHGRRQGNRGKNR